MNDFNIEELDNIDNKIIEDVNSIGWSVILIKATRYLPSFAYTIGLWKNYQHSEIIAFGLTTDTLHAILNIAGENIKAGVKYTIGQNYSEFFINSDAQFLTVDNRNIRDYFGYAIWFNRGTDFPAIELIWTDRNNKFPWDEDYQEEFLYRQPLLDRNAEFKFREDRDLGVYTTRQWLELGKPILRVVHEDDGDWQFLTCDQMPEDIRLVALEAMIKSDPSLNDIFNLEYGVAAERTDISARWDRHEIAYDE